MFASSHETRGRRRGIVLVLVLGMLGLLALIGVTFATFAGQSLINGRNFNQGVARPQPEALMDFALGQLINDTNNPLSAIRGHSLLRDMYGNDSVFRGANPPANASSEFGGVLQFVYNGSPQPSPLVFTGQTLRINSASVSPTPFYNQVQYQTNIPTSGQYYGLDFTRWIVRFPTFPVNVSNPISGNTVGQTFEILEDDYSGGYHLFTLSNNLTNPTQDPTYPGMPAPNPYSAADWTSFIYVDQNNGPAIASTSATPPVYTYTKAYSSLAREFNTQGSAPGTLSTANPSNPFILDGRYMRAFNGPGLTKPDLTGIGLYPYNYAAYANYRAYNANVQAYNAANKTSFPTLDPDSYGMDEDYDACDLENWFLAIQSADGQVMIPSFHRPAILSATDWTNNQFLGNPKILRPRQADHSPLFPADPSSIDSNGKLTFDVDNDGDGVTDSVWLDLGYPVQRDPRGQLYKPLFAFMVLGLNGRMPLNTAGNLQYRAIGNQYNTTGAGGIAIASTTPPSGLAASTTQVAQPGFYTPDSNNSYLYRFSSQTYLDAPTWDHASHLGYSVNEINPKFALQNAPANVYPSGTVSTNGYGDYSQTNFSQVDNAGVSVALTQLRNILTGTVPTDIPAGQTWSKNWTNYDSNLVNVNGQTVVLPNNLADSYDGPGYPTPTTVLRGLTPVPGRWGEPQGVPKFLTAAGSGVFTPGGTITNGVHFSPLYFDNPVRAGNSVYLAGPNGTSTPIDPLDDDYDSADVLLNTYGTALLNYYSPPNANAAYQVSIPRIYPEMADNFDIAGQSSMRSEAIRRFVLPIDPSGAGRLVSFMNRPNTDFDYGNGYDRRGRLGFFRYFRPPGLPQDIRYPYGGQAQSGIQAANYTYEFSTSNTYQVSSYAPGSLSQNALGQRFLMAQLYTAGQVYLQSLPAVQATTTMSDIGNNRYHGFQSMLTPFVNPTATAASAGPPAVAAVAAVTQETIASMGAMPYDWDTSVHWTGQNTPGDLPIDTNGDVPAGYGSSAIPGTPVWLASPVINPFAPAIPPQNLYGSAAPVYTYANSHNGPNVGLDGNPGATTSPNPYPTPYGSYADATATQPYGATVVNGYLLGSLNKDEADEMNLFTVNQADMPFGASDLEWLYRKQDVDGATLTSRLSKLAPVSFLNPADGLTRRRMFSTDTWDLTGFSWANDNPIPYAGILGGSGPVNALGQAISSDHDYSFNSRFSPIANANLEGMNQVAATAQLNGSPYVPLMATSNPYANPITTEFLPNPTLPQQGYDLANGNALGNSVNGYVPNSGYLTSLVTLPTHLDPANPGTLFDKTQFPNATLGSYGLIVPHGTVSAAQVQTPSLAHRDRRINLNQPVPVSHDPAEPIRQKWVRETYQMMKAVLPPSSIDTPEELAALSQFVVNIMDFRDPDPAMTRFVNTDLEVTDVLTKTASPVQPTTGTNFDTTWNVSPGGVKFATSTIPIGHFPYDPSIYSPDSTTTFLVQHGMEYNPIAINEAFGYQYQYGTAGALTTGQGIVFELVNTLSEEANNTGSGNASAIPLRGWDLVMTPDNYGWGRPDPITGDVSPIALPPQLPGTPATLPPANGAAPLNAVKYFPFTSGTVNAISKSGPSYAFTVAAYTGGGNQAPSNAESNPIAASSVTLPTTFLPPTLTVGSGTGKYYWVYLRRPANPFDTTALDPANRPNREMVVVDAMRFPYIEAGTTGSYSDLYSARRLQPYRGGHLLRTNTTAGTAATTKPAPTAANPNATATSPATGVTTICPPSPPYAYGYTEQTAPATTASSDHGQSSSGGTYTNTTGGATTTTAGFYQTIDSEGSPKDTSWCPLVINDRDFTSVAELLMVPGCPPGLFTKQFVEEPYPGWIATPTTTPTTFATGSDDTDLASPVKAPTPSTKPVGGRVDFGVTSPAIPEPTFPYLPDNFYYTAASVAPPMSGTLDTNFTHLTTEIGGWTGAGWHKMLEFFEVPSSANGAIGTAANGTNYDWYRTDIKPGLLNLNLIIDEEVFAGLIDDPRLNENLAYLSSSIPYVVSLIDSNGYPDSSTGTYARYPIYGQPSTNILNTDPMTMLPKFGNDPPNPQNYSGLLAGRGYVLRDADIQNYTDGASAPPNLQYLHGIKAAFSDFLKLRHGGSGYLFAFGGGAVGSGDFALSPQTFQVQPIAAERPYRSLSFPDIDYTILRPASLPPTPQIVHTAGAGGTPTVIVPGTSPALPPTIQSGTPPTATAGGLTEMFNYLGQTGNPFVTLNPALAPLNVALGSPAGTDYQYVQDPGLKNPYLAIQYQSQPTATDNRISPQSTTAANRRLGPPYDTQEPTGSPAPAPTPPAAPFPPPIPPTPTRRLFQVPDYTSANNPTSNASIVGQADTNLSFIYSVNQQVVTPSLTIDPNSGPAPSPASNPPNPPVANPPTLVAQFRPVFAPNNYTPQINGYPPASLVPATVTPAPTPPAVQPTVTTVNNYLGAGPSTSLYAGSTVPPATTDRRQHPLYRTEWLQKISNLTTVRTHQFATWITVGFFEVVKVGTPELDIPDTLGQEIGLAKGDSVRYRSFFVIDRTKATGFNPYNPGNFRNCVTYRRRIE